MWSIPQGVLEHCFELLMFNAFLLCVYAMFVSNELLVMLFSNNFFSRFVNVLYIIAVVYHSVTVAQVMLAQLELGRNNYTSTQFHRIHQ